MKVAVIGGGFTGCMAALHSAQEGHEVTLLESGDRLGGVLRDVEASGGLYLNGWPRGKNQLYFVVIG